ncbi:heterokaryon incompatibility protein-domain-containing protein [Podospora aff. communis PSN243]|uniref:Heterokaryon incompatibility protein-domain-containing protein n=1 Tax=Podospora aff. communis PSN243 TaxID=3040156 RepID=A0AAV9GTB9_9PEZI|nr:heterokaryon incompatibility protein-domain-containing protein [Podospora aff. communis PSN243]
MASTAKKQVSIIASPDASFLHNRLWLSNSAPPGQLLVARLDPATDSTKLVPLEAKSLRSYLGFGQPPDGTVDGGKPLLACRGEPKLGADALAIPRGQERVLLHRFGRHEELGLGSVLTNHVGEKDAEQNPLLHRNFGRSQFRIASADPNPGAANGDVYFSIDPELYTPDARHPFRGVWIWELEPSKFEFLLLHQESEHQLELFKLIADDPVPNGVTSIVAVNIRDVNRRSSDSDEEWKWNDVPIVAAKIQASDSTTGKLSFLDVELAGVSESEIVLLLGEEHGNAAIQLKRVDLDMFISAGELAIPDCCCCGDAKNTASLDEWTVSSDAEALGLERGRGTVLSAFETPSTAPRRDSVQMHKICGCCESFLSQVPLRRKKSAKLLPPTSQHRLHASVKGLQNSAAVGCHLCSLINYSLSAAGWLDGKTSEGVYILYTCFEGRGRERVVKDDNPVPPLEKPSIYISLHPTGESLETFIKPGVSPENWYKFRSITSDGNEAHPSHVPHRAATRSETSSRAHMNLARGWLDQCNTHHDPCRRRDPEFIPTRLLDVGGPAIRLALTNPDDRSKYTNYCCLSHCWGGVTDIPLLETDTLNSFVSEIDINTLPRTFQDAILITRQLHIRYLWIDSLCIIQNSADDWTKEAAVMGKIYENGYCTISAAEATSGHGGCFVRRNPLNCNAVRVAHFRNSEMLFQPSTYPHLQTSKSGYSRIEDVPAQRLQMMDVFTSKLASRGWVFQEALLSPRILYLSKGLFWNCKAGQASELDPLGRGMLHQGMYYGAASDAIFREPLELSRSELAKRRAAGEPAALEKKGPVPEGKGRSEVHDQIFFLFSGGRALGLGSPGRAEYNAVCDLARKFRAAGTISSKSLHREWMGLVATYSRLQLTFESDRLPALAGIAQTAISLAGDALKGQYIAGMWRCTLLFDLLFSQGAVQILEGHEPRPRASQNGCPSWSWASVGGAVESYLATRQDEWPAGMEPIVEIVSATAEYDPLDTARTGKVTGGGLILKGFVIPCKTEVRRYSWTSTVDVWLADEEGRDIGEAQPDTDPYEFVEGATFAVPFLRMEDQDEVDLHGLVLVQRDGVFFRVAKWSATTPKGETLDMSRYQGFERVITVK